MGICLHPKYGGWFAMRCVLIFKNLLVSEAQLPLREPSDRLEGDAERILDLLHKFNYNWRDSSYRDCIRAEERYSPIQLEYFLLEPKRRKALILDWLRHSSVEELLESYDEKLKSQVLMKNFYLV